nr:hypothetical protein [Synechocystis sp. LEGE 06083]
MFCYRKLDCTNHCRQLRRGISDQQRTCTVPDRYHYRNLDCG